MIQAKDLLAIESFFDGAHQGLIHYTITQRTDGKEVKFGFFDNFFLEDESFEGILEDIVQAYLLESANE